MTAQSQNSRKSLPVPTRAAEADDGTRQLLQWAVRSWARVCWLRCCLKPCWAAFRIPERARIRLVCAHRRADVHSLRRPSAGSGRRKVVSQSANRPRTLILCYSFQLLECTDMAKSVNKVILLGNVGKDFRNPFHPSGTMVDNSVWPPATAIRTRKATGRTAPSGTTWWPSSAPPRLSGTM